MSSRAPGNIARQLAVRLACLAFILNSIGCVGPSFLARSDLNTRISAITSVGILPPSVDVYEIDLSDVPKRIDAWSETAKGEIWAAAETEMRKLKGIQVNTIPLDSLSESQRTDITESQLVFDAVDVSLLWLLSSAHLPQYAEKLRQFDYSLGSFSGTGAGADAFLVIKAFDHISSTGRKVMNFINLSVMAAGAAARVPILFAMPLGKSAVSVALVDARTGEILWYRSEHSSAGLTDLREPQSAALMMRMVLKEFPVSH